MRFTHALVGDTVPTRVARAATAIIAAVCSFGRAGIDRSRFGRWQPRVAVQAACTLMEQ